MKRAYDEIVNFIASGPTPGALAEWKASRKVRDRVATLLQREKNGKISPQEKAELDDYMELEHLMRLVKAKVRQL